MITCELDFEGLRAVIANCEGLDDLRAMRADAKAAALDLAGTDTPTCTLARDYQIAVEMFDAEIARRNN